jgi:hypothetical protein
MPPELEDDFTKHFDTAATEGTALPNEPQPVEPAPAEPAPAEPTPAPAEPAPAAPAPAEPAPAEPAPAEPTPAPAEPAPNVDDVVSRLAAALKEAQPPAPATTEPAPAASAEVEAPIYSQQEMQLLQDYEKNWPDVAQAEALKRRAEYGDLLKYVFSSVSEFLKEPLEQLRSVTNFAHTSELRSAVPDYSEDLEQKVTEWIGTQPDYLQSAYSQVMQAGTSDQVADLIRRYQGAVGTAPAPQPQALVQPAPAAPAKKTELSSAAKQAAEALAPVGTERTSVPQGEDPMDFNAAFKKYAETGVSV